MIDSDYKDAVIYQDGKIEGKIERDFEIAKAMKAKQYAIEDIAHITGLPIEDIEKL